MKNYCIPLILVGLIAFIMTPIINAAERLERGKDHIVAPAIALGLCAHNLFQSGMVLQRDKPIRVWGWAEPGEKVAASFGGASQATEAAADRTWALQLPAMPANAEPQTLTIQGRDKKVEFEDILVGDVWLLGGQSNMEFEITKVENGQLEVASANFKNIRLFSVPQMNGPDHKKSFARQYRWSDWFNQHYREGFWDVCSPDTVREMSAIGYVFARRIHMATEIPIGVIDASRGGTCIETWIPMDVLKTIDTAEVKTTLDEWDKKIAAFNPQADLALRIKNFNDRLARMKAEGKPIPADSKAPTEVLPGPALDMNRPGNCYASMISPIAGFPIKGAIWHQGFNNAMQPNGHAMYYQVFAKMITAWRAAFDDPQMPFGIISLCTAGDPQNADNSLEMMADEGILIRDVHYKTFLDFQKAGDKNIGYASSFDLRRSWFHPQIKIPAGERIAAWALATQYGKKVRWLPPQLKSVEAAAGKIVLKLDSTVGPFHDGPMEGFVIAGKDGRFQPATVQWLNKNEGKSGAPVNDQSTIILTSPLVPEPLYFRHAWGRNPLANVKSVDHTDLPFATQRNDTWTLADQYEIYTGKKSKIPNVLDRAEHGELKKALQADDMKRRVEEAKALLKANGIKIGNE